MSEKINEIEIQGYENEGDSRLLVLLKEDDYLLLREQAEQVQELEKIKESHIEELGYVDERLLEAEHQNKRYRKALEEISTTELPGIPIEKHINLLRKIADKALEDSQ